MNHVQNGGYILRKFISKISLIKDGTCTRMGHSQAKPFHYVFFGLNFEEKLMIPTGVFPKAFWQWRFQHVLNKER